ncbi:carbonic anhydrase [Photobacterium phosphoreum]|uniref:carbonic anhydrase n=1 Tax=Photobacterium phosphoreum TaxID=659 RepID=UPI000D178A20|nr:carbonic anhydrase family protein [Photobacterium phosphoreum]PTB32102.1 carbonic anhydrase [Photobacterium phosphoreum]
MKKNTVSALVLALATCFSLSAHANAAWGYGDQQGSEHWVASYPTCGGENQSPIDIQDPIQAQTQPLQINYDGKITSITNNGHTISANVSGDNKVIIDGDTYTLKQFHFHTPSENYIDGKQYPLEAHFVNVDASGHIAVIAVMFENGPRANNELTTLLKTIPTKGETIDFNGDLTPNALLPRERQYFRYNGSLTTPPCTEGVRWYVMQSHLTSSAAQIEQLNQMMGDNNRPLQPLNARIVID